MRPVTLPSGSRVDLDKVSFIGAHYFFAVVDGVNIAIVDEDHPALVAAWDQRSADYARIIPFRDDDKAPDREESFR